MIEDFALSVLDTQESYAVLACAVLIALGGILAWATGRPRRALRRAPYFALKGIAVLGLTQLHHIALQMVGPALAGEYLWALILMLAVGYLLYGFVLVRLSAARSLDAFGHVNFALLGLVPLLSLMLLFKRSKEDPSVRPWASTGLLSGEMGVFLGFATFVLAIALNNYLADELPERVAEAENSTPLAGDFLRLRLRKVAEGFAAPRPYYLGTQVVGADQRKNQLHFRVVSGRPADRLTESAQDIIRRMSCADPDMKTMIKDGIVWVLDFQDAQGGVYASVIVDSTACRA
jgi:hypothetical protein